MKPGAGDSRAITVAFHLIERPPDGAPAVAEPLAAVTRARQPLFAALLPDEGQ